MNTFLNTINGVISVVGFTSMIVGFIYIGRKLRILDELKETLETIEHDLKVVTDFLSQKFSDFPKEDLKK